MKLLTTSDLAFVYPFLILIMMSGCDIKSLDEKNPEVQNGSDTRPNFSAQVLEGRTVNSFSVKLLLPQGQNFIVTRELNGEKQLESLAATEFLDNSVVAGQSYKYSIGAITGKSFLKLQTLEVAIPIDIYVEGTKLISEENLGQLEHIRNLVFASGGALITNGLNIKLNAQKLISHGGILATYPLDAVAAADSPGRSGGKIELTADSAEGFLKIIMRGESGGPGRNGAEQKAGRRGESGHSGGQGGSSGSIYIRNIDRLKIEVVHQPGSGGPGGAGAKTHQGNCNSGRFKMGSGKSPMSQDTSPQQCETITPDGDPGSAGTMGAFGDTCEFDLQTQTDICKSGSSISD